jgi:hypothetical protein
MANTDNKITGSGRGKSGDRHEMAAEEYWTEERRAAAKPVPLPKVTPGKAPAATEPEKRGETGHTQHGHGEEKNPE